MDKRELIEKVLDCRVFTLVWAFRNELVLAGECADNKFNYHVFPQYGVFELVDANGRIN